MTDNNSARGRAAEATTAGARTLPAVLKDLLAMDLTFENSDDGHVRRRGQAAALAMRDALAGLSDQERDWLVRKLAAKLSEQPASLVTACSILGRPAPILSTAGPTPPPRSTPPSPDEEAPDPNNATEEAPPQAEQPENPPSHTTKTAPVVDAPRKTRQLLRRILDGFLKRKKAREPWAYSPTQTKTEPRGDRLTSRQDARPGPGHTTELRAMLANPIQHRGPLLDNLFHAGSTSIEAKWKTYENGTMEHVWSSAHGLYRTRRPETLGKQELLNTTVTVEPDRDLRWTVVTCQSVPLYAEDVGRQTRSFTTQEEAIRYADKFIADRFRVVRDEVLELLASLNTDDSLQTSIDAHAAVLELIVKLLGENYRSPCAPLIGTWRTTLKAFLDEVAKQKPEAVELYFSLLPEWSLGKRELKTTVQLILDSETDDASNKTQPGRH